MTFRFMSAGTYNTTTGEIVSSVSDSTIKGILNDVNAREVNELIQAGDKRLTIAADDLTAAPQTDDQVLIGDVVHQIVSVETTEQQNIAITYDLVLRA